MKTIPIVAVTIALTAFHVQANENPIINTVEKAKDMAVNNQVVNFVVDEWNGVKTLQQESFAEGKDQLVKNKEQIVNIFTNVKGAFTHYFTKTVQ